MLQCWKDASGEGALRTRGEKEWTGSQVSEDTGGNESQSSEGTRTRNRRHDSTETGKMGVGEGKGMARCTHVRAEVMR